MEKDHETRSINNFLAFLLIGCLIAPNVAEINDGVSYAINLEYFTK